MADSRIYRFGVFELDPGARELRKRGLKIRLQDQPFRVLSKLLESSPRIVERDELQRELWPDDTFVDFNHGLNSAVNRIRQALGDSASNPRFIETAPKVGYRFIAPLEVREPAPVEPRRFGPAPQVPSAAPPPGPETPRARPFFVARALALAVIAFALLLFLALGIWVTSPPPPDPPAAAADSGGWAIRILAGSDQAATDADGNVWSADAYVTGGETVGRGQSVLSADPDAPGLAEPILYRGERYGNFRYLIPAPPGDYLVRLYFAETWFGPGNAGGGGVGSRAFQVILNGEVWLDRFDILEEAGGPNRGFVVERRVTVPADDNRITVDFVSQFENAAVNAIEIVPATNEER